MGFWADVNKARGSRGGIYFLAAEGGGEAEYRIRIDKLVADKTRRGLGLFVMETTVIRSSQPRRPPGSHPSSAIVMDKDAADGNVADICRAALACLCNTVLAGGPQAVQGLAKELEHYEMGATANLLIEAEAQGTTVDADEVVLSDPGIGDFLGGPDNPCADLELDLVAFERPIKSGANAGRPFTHLRLSVPQDVLDAARDARGGPAAQAG